MGSTTNRLEGLAHDQRDDLAGDQRDDLAGDRLRRLRLAQGLSLRDVERRTDGKLKSSHLSQIENNKVIEPSLAVLRALAGAYRLSLIDLMDHLGYLQHGAPTDVAAARTEHEVAAIGVIRNLEPDQQRRAVELLQVFAAAAGSP